MNSKEVTEAYESAIGSHGERWRHCEDLPESTLLRLAILRDIARGLHAQKSRCLALGQKNLGQSINTWEARIEQLRSYAQLNGDLSAFMKGTEERQKRTRFIPEALFLEIDREKLERYDRTWEAALAAEASTQGWKFWTLEAWVEVTRAEEWNQRLVEQLWPSGLVLFVESSSAGAHDERALTPIWKGKWICVLHPRIADPSELTPHAARWPGAATSAPSSAHWKVLFSAKAAG